MLLAHGKTYVVNSLVIQVLRGNRLADDFFKNFPAQFLDCHIRCMLRRENNRMHPQRDCLTILASGVFDGDLRLGVW